MILNFPKIFKGKELDVEFTENDIVEASPLDENSEGQNDQELPSVTEGRVTIHFSNVSSDAGGLMMGFFIGNGYRQKAKFKKIPLVLLDSERKILARQTFGGETIGTVAGGTMKACVVRFHPENVYSENIPEDCQVRFDLQANRPQSIEIKYQNLPDNISLNQKQELERILKTLPPIKHGEADFSPLCAKLAKENNILATVIIRNTTNKPIVLEEIPLAFVDANQEELARGIFDVKTITIEPFKAILWTFNFDLVKQGSNIDLSTWQIKVLES